MEINIECLVRERIAEMELEGYVREAIESIITKDVRTTINKIVTEESREIILTEIKKVLDGPVKTDDGWGNRETYPAFSDLFKQVLRKKMADSYEVKREIERNVQSRVDSIMKTQYAGVVEKIVNELTGSYLKKEG